MPDQASPHCAPPSMDLRAARRWQRVAPAVAPWLHDEVGSRMEQRLQWIKRQPATWASWDPARAGDKAQTALQQRYPGARACRATDKGESACPDVAKAQRPWWNPASWLTPTPSLAALPATGVDLLWANMVLHNSAAPQELIAGWHQAVAVDGFLMFSCLGPDSLRELRQIYAQQGWGVIGHELTDMHDWGDMLVQAGFAEPVMDMERIVLGYQKPARLLEELRELGRNFHPGRFAGLRGRKWRDALMNALAQGLPQEAGTGRMTVTFEVIYGHAFKAAPRLRNAGETLLSVDEVRAAMRRGRKPPAAV